MARTVVGRRTLEFGPRSGVDDRAHALDHSWIWLAGTVVKGGDLGDMDPGGIVCSLTSDPGAQKAQ